MYSSCVVVLQADCTSTSTAIPFRGTHDINCISDDDAMALAKGIVTIIRMLNYAGKRQHILYLQLEALQADHGLAATERVIQSQGQGLYIIMIAALVIHHAFISTPRLFDYKHH